VNDDPDIEPDDDPALLERAFKLTADFYAWERRGRGWDLWPYAVDLEPPFRPYYRESNSGPSPRDDARKPTFLGVWLERLLGRQAGPSVATVEKDVEPDPKAAQEVGIKEFLVALPADSAVAPEQAEHFLLSLGSCSSPIGFEIIAAGEEIAVQICCGDADASHVRGQLLAHFPESVLTERSGFLNTAWWSAQGDHVVVDFGLMNEFMRPLHSFGRFSVDPLTGIVGALDDVGDGELAALQILFQPARHPWARSVLRSVTDWEGAPFFVDAPELVSQANEKVSRPLYAVTARVATRAGNSERAWALARRVGGALAQLGNPGANELVAVSNEDYPDDEHLNDFLSRLTRRTGMLLNTEELVSVVHPPSASVRIPKLVRERRRTKAAPKALLANSFALGHNTHGGLSQQVSIRLEHRLRHTHVVGASGTGKSTLLLHLLIQDIEQGFGVALIDPHGDLVDRLLCHIPDRRSDDVIVVNSSDIDRPVGFNVLSAHSDLERTLLSSDLVAVFRRLSTSWGDQMTSVLANAVLAFLESSKGGTLADLRRFLVEAEFRREFLKTVRDSEVLYYWEKEFTLLSGKPQAPILTRLDSFLRPRIIRNMVSQPTSLDFAEIMDSGKILLVKLAQGAIGEENAALLGSLFVAKIQQMAVSRQALPEENRRPFFLYLDEFQHFVTPSMAAMLTGARKFKVGLTLAHQELRQLWNQDRDVAGAVLANAATRICFRVGDEDAKRLAEGLSGFEPRDLLNLGLGEAACRVDRADWDFSLSAPSTPAESAEGPSRREAIIQRSRERYGAAAAQAAIREPGPPPVSDGVLEAVTAHSQVPRQSHIETPAVESTPRTPGRGGAQHKYLQELIRRWGEANGWRATIEQPVLDGLGQVDVALERESLRVACEISIASTVEYEIGNVRKCLAAGFSHVALIATERRALKKLIVAIDTELEPTDRGLVQAFAPEELFSFLEQLTALPSSDQFVSKGYNITVRRAKSRSGTAAPSIARTVVEALRRLRGNG
jgi:hypothetical protein